MSVHSLSLLIFFSFIFWVCVTRVLCFNHANALLSFYNKYYKIYTVGWNWIFSRNFKEILKLTIVRMPCFILKLSKKKWELVKKFWSNGVSYKNIESSHHQVLTAYKVYNIMSDFFFAVNIVKDTAFKINLFRNNMFF